MRVLNQEKIQLIFDFVEPNDDYFDLGLCNRDLVAVAGTGDYRANIGKSRPETHLAEVVKTGKSFILYDKNSSENCLNCPGKDACLYKGVIYLPLRMENEILGAIYLMHKHQLNINSDLDLYVAFLNKLSSFVGHTITSDELVYQNENKVNCLLQLSHDGLISVNNKGIINEINVPARKILNVLSSDLRGTNVRELLSDVRLVKNYEFHLKDNYKIKIHPVGDVGFILHIRPEFKFDGSEMDFIVGRSEALKAAKERASIISKHDSPALIIGETGTGKELFAHSIHKQSARGKKQLITLDCSSIPGNLLESELFGYEEGAFTGAKHGGKKGKLELSNMSSIFLDEIGELPLHLQSKLLRVIENNSFDRLGDTKTTFVNIRIIAATNCDLSQMVQDNKFRKDLYYRLNVMQLDIPPLREREGDIEILTQYYLNFFNNKFNKRIRISDEISIMLPKYNWPGNVRELKNLMEYCVAFAKEEITYETLPEWFKKSLICSHYSAPPKDESLSMDSAEKSYIEKSLLLHGSSTKGKVEAAKSLGISLATLYRKLKKYNLE